MTLRMVPRAVTEAAVHYLHASYVDHLRATAAMPPQRGRVLSGGTVLGPYESAEVSRQTCFFRLISLVEAYVDIISSALFRDSAPTTHELVRRLMEAAELRGSSSWRERKTAFERYHGIRLGQLARWSELDCGIEVRNAIAHGLGRLTLRQRNGTTARKLGTIGVGVRDGAVFVTDDSLVRCRDLCIDFVRSLDLALPPMPTGPNT